MSDAQRCRAVIVYGGRGFAGRYQAMKAEASDLCGKHKALEDAGRAVTRREGTR